MASRPSPWPARCGHAAFTLGVLYAAISAYWAAGGTAGLDTLGGELERLALARDPGLVAAGWAAAGLKLIAAVLGLAAVRPWGRRLPYRPVLWLGWAAAVVLIGYGGALVAGQSLVRLGIVRAASDIDWTAFYWHLLVWDPWFLAWGLLLAVALRGFTRRRCPAALPRPDPAGQTAASAAATNTS